MGNIITSSSSPRRDDETGNKETKGGVESKSMKSWLIDKPLGTAANLSKLLPTGTTLTFQTLAPSFTKGGNCTGHGVNFCFTWGLIGFLTLLTGVLSFTDSVTDRDGRTYYGCATCYGLWLFNGDLDKLPLFDIDDEEEEKKQLEQLKQSKKLKKRDFMHAIVSAAVFATLAFCDASVQRCLLPEESEQWKEFLANLPLAVGFLASFLFMIFPTTRNGIGDDGPDAPPDMKPTAKPAGEQHAPHGNNPNKCSSSLMTMDTAQVAPRTSYEINDQVV
ncbi:hypothetical protein QOZ80_1AG0043620 [Eleusine coracana subsp. coracana]|nr:hypothetical protein QOZ80_1AG0043620 [Eleusine coracana subsp. coracana]